ncbi:hypothetical protein [Pseudomonas sp. 6D_7.1_Bac1]|uniref:hypothetical protein n=1 Tax=Pseudomonas sp. 6D_7.1_Bac1 TaxID=2971615 RepID=UPI0021C597B8|nr:hypothetical protein [Pseudomonas sp. 6D_7.1_Bac1]MCU1750210.1 hypothetical protein [Pseudomonas sp. 6D_7.1_Bac1]
MVQRRQYHISQISLRLEGLRASLSQFKRDELEIQETLRGTPVLAIEQALDEAFDEIRESINHTEELLEALVQVAGSAPEKLSHRDIAH